MNVDPIKAEKLWKRFWERYANRKLPDAATQGLRVIPSDADHQSDLDAWEVWLRDRGRLGLSQWPLWRDQQGTRFYLFPYLRPPDGKQARKAAKRLAREVFGS